MKFLITSIMMMGLCVSAFAADEAKNRNWDVAFRCEFHNPGYPNGNKEAGGPTYCRVRGRAEVLYNAPMNSSNESRREEFLEIECTDGSRFHDRRTTATLSGNDLLIAAERNEHKLALILIEDVLRSSRRNDTFSSELLYSSHSFVAKRLSGRCELDTRKES